MKKILAELDRMAPMGQHGKGPEFEKYLKRILEIAPEFRSQFKKVWLWEDYPDRRGADLGIDLVAENKQGERVAIQAKCYAPNGSLTWRELSTFYGDAMGRAEISQLMLVTTTDQCFKEHKGETRRGAEAMRDWDSFGSTQTRYPSSDAPQGSRSSTACQNVQAPASPKDSDQEDAGSFEEEQAWPGPHGLWDGQNACRPLDQGGDERQANHRVRAVHRTP